MNKKYGTDGAPTFPHLHKPTPNTRRSKAFPREPKSSVILRSNEFPGLLTTAKLSVGKVGPLSFESSKAVIGQTPAFFGNLKLDRLSRVPHPTDTSCHSQTHGLRSYSIINLGISSSSNDESLQIVDGTKGLDYQNGIKKDEPYRFIIYRGTALSSTPEFESYRLAYAENWSAIAGVIRELEDYLRLEEVKLAIIDGVRVHDISYLYSVTGIFKEDLISCITNIEGASATSSFSRREPHTNTEDWAATIIQHMVRNFLCWNRYLEKRLQNRSALLIQCRVRRLLAIRLVKTKVVEAKVNSDNQWLLNVEKLKRLWVKAAQAEAALLLPLSSFALGHSSQLSVMEGFGSSISGTQSNADRLLIFVPSMSCAEYIRLFTDRLCALQNMHIACLYQLIDPHVHVLYVSPVHLSEEEVAYHESFLSVLGVPATPGGGKRLHFVVPEMANRLPSHLSIAQVLWYSTQALKKIKIFICQIPNATIVPSSLSWVEKRLSHHLNVPLLSPDPCIASTIACRSFIKQVFEEACVSTPHGVQDIYSSTDFFVGLSSLITSNIDVRRWVFRLNADFNNEGYAFLDVDKLSVTATLRAEISSLLDSGDGRSGVWYSKHVQLEVRKRVLLCLRAELPSKVTLCRGSMHGHSWEHFEKHFRVCGLVIEAEPVAVTGHVLGLCFTDPNGGVQATDGVDLLVDRNYQVQGYLGPQSQVPPLALQGATAAVAKLLYEKWGVIGYLAVEFQSHWDALEGAPRLLALGVKLGLSPAFVGLGAAAVAGSKGPDLHLPRSMVPLADVPKGKHFVFLPYAYHRPLCACRDDAFLRCCKMKGVGFDTEARIGALFFRIDAMLGGSISTLSVGNSRKRAIDTAVHTLNFVVSQFGRDSEVDSGSEPSWESLTSILANLSAISKKESKKK